MENIFFVFHPPNNWPIQTIIEEILESVYYNVTVDPNSTSPAFTVLKIVPYVGNWPSTWVTFYVMTSRNINAYMIFRNEYKGFRRPYEQDTSEMVVNNQLPLAGGRYAFRRLDVPVEEMNRPWTEAEIDRAWRKGFRVMGAGLVVHDLRTLGHLPFVSGMQFLNPNPPTSALSQAPSAAQAPAPAPAPVPAPAPAPPPAPPAPSSSTNPSGGS